ncbi:hypothetical protein FAIPA1_230010 [Frankia sp. AiPs1]
MERRTGESDAVRRVACPEYPGSRTAIPEGYPKSDDITHCDHYPAPAMLGLMPGIDFRDTPCRNVAREASM